MVQAIIVGSILEVASLLLQAYLKLMDQTGMSEEEKTIFEANERRKFLENKSSELPKPPAIDSEPEDTHS